MNWLDDLYSEFSAKDDFSPAYVLGFLERRRLQLEKALADRVKSQRLQEMFAWIALHLAMSDRSPEAVLYAEGVMKTYSTDEFDREDDAKRHIQIARMALALAFFHLHRLANALEVLKAYEASAPDQSWARNMRSLIQVIRSRRYSKYLTYVAAALVVLSWSSRKLFGWGHPLIPAVGLLAFIGSLILDSRIKRRELILRQQARTIDLPMKVVR